MLNQYRRAAFGRYVGKALSSGALAKVVRDPAIIARTLKTIATNRNFRTVSPEGLLRKKSWTKPKVIMAEKLFEQDAQRTQFYRRMLEAAKQADRD